MAELTEEQIKVEWDKADTDKSGSLDFKEIVALLDKFNLKLKEKQVKKIFKEVDEDSSGQLDFNEFRKFLSLLRSRPEVEQLFDALYEQFHEDDDEDAEESKEKFWSANEFLQFLREIQKETDADLETAKEIIKAVEPGAKKKKDTELCLSVRGLSAYMSTATINGLFEPKHKKVYQDMTQPLPQYFLASSHNTYLLGDQLKGESSVQAYINAFKKGCKCVELDCWDGDDKIPIIYHGHTLTSKITFKEVVETVRDYGFVTSDYPVILSLEVHCGIEGQQKMAQIVHEVLGAAGMIPKCPEDTGKLLSPEEYKRKVLLKGKRLAASKKEQEEEEALAEAEEEEEEAASATPQTETKDPKKADASPSPSPHQAEKKKKKKEHTAKELSDLIHLKTVGIKNFEENKAKKPPSWAMSSFSESKVEKILAKHAADFIEYNSRQLSRIYPKGIRVDSSNYDPTPSWNCGSQIVALNYQTGSEPMWLNDGKFHDNGNCGYILKPQFMRQENITFNPESPGPVQKTLLVKVISGWQFPKVQGTAKEEKQKGQVIDPYVCLEMKGVSKDKSSVRTKTIKNNGFNPVWNTEFKFPITTPELAILLVSVYDEDVVSRDDFIGHFPLNVYNIREGYRVIPLKDKHGSVYEKASLLIHVSWEDSESKAKESMKHEGLLLKKASSRWTNKWEQRFFVLQNSEMKYYQSKNTSGKPRKYFSVKDVVCSPVKADKNFEHSFMIVSAHPTHRTWFLKAASAQELRQWKRNLLIQGAKWQPKAGREYTVSANGAVAKKKR